MSNSRGQIIVDTVECEASAIVPRRPRDAIDERGRIVVAGAVGGARSGRLIEAPSRREPGRTEDW